MSRKLDNSIAQWCGLEITKSKQVDSQLNSLETNKESNSTNKTEVYPNLAIQEPSKTVVAKGLFLNNQTNENAEDFELEGFLKSLTSLKNKNSNYVDNFYVNEATSNLNQYNLYSSQILNDFLCNSETESNNKSENKDYATRWNSYYEGINSKQDLSNATKSTTQTKMSGGPPHHPHGRQAPSPNTAWNHLQVPNYFPRLPQHAHMSNEAPKMSQPTWHTPTTEPVPKSTVHSHIFNLEQMISDRSFAKHSPGVDLSIQRNGSQNGELPTTPISLSVRDANKINSLPASAIDVQGSEITKSMSPILKSMSPGLKVAAASLKIASPVLKTGIPNVSIIPPFNEKSENTKNVKRPTKRMDLIIERLNPTTDKNETVDKVVAPEKLSTVDTEKVNSTTEKSTLEKPSPSSVIVNPVNTTTITSHDENSNSNNIITTVTLLNTQDEDVISPYSNEDSTDSNKSRRKRKPSKTIRVSKDLEKVVENTTEKVTVDLPVEDQQQPELKPTIDSILEERPRSDSAPPGNPSLPPRTRRKTSSESETIDNIAAMVQNPAFNKVSEDKTKEEEESEDVPKAAAVSVSVIKEIKEDHSKVLPINLADKIEVTPSPKPVFQTPAQKKITDPNSFVEVENKLEEMFAGISDDVEPTNMSIHYDNSKSLTAEISKAENSVNLDSSSVQLNDSVTSTSNDLDSTASSHQNKRKRMKSAKGESSMERSKKKKSNKKSKLDISQEKTKSSSKKSKGKLNNSKQSLSKIETMKEHLSYDSGSNASSSRSRGPFVQIKGSRDSPISVNIVNTPTNDEDVEKKSHKSSKKYHDDTEYRHKVRSRGLHCSTLSNKYDAQTRDATWICVFCKRGPHATDPQLSGPSRFSEGDVPPPGDLFGPYVITAESPEYQRRLDDPYDEQFKSKKVARAVVANNKIINRKFKRKHSDSFDSRSSLDGNDSVDIYLGITETRDKVYEVWAHEDCIVWSPGIYLIGPKIIGLEEAVWTSCNVICNKCKYKGANVCCITRGCMNVVHHGCAFAADWYLDDGNFKAYCSMHKKQ